MKPRYSEQVSQSLGSLLYQGSIVSGKRVKQRVTCIQAAKKRHSEENYTVLTQNRLFECNQKRLFEELEGNQRTSDVMPVAEEY